jgi:hypothetical protein
MDLIQEFRDLGIQGFKNLGIERILSFLIYRFYPLIPQFGTNRHR